MEEQPMKPAPSVSATMMNVFASPGEAFAELPGSDSKPMLWVAPMLALMLFALILTYVMFTNSVLHEQILDMQRHGMEKAVAQGKMTQEQADQASDRMQQGGMLFMVIGGVARLVMIAIYYFGAALFLWLAGKFILKSNAGYGKYLEVFGIGSWIGVLGIVITMLMIVGLGNLFAGPNAAITIYSSFDMENKVHRILGGLGIFSAWQAYATGIGLSALSGKSPMTGAGVAVGMWLAFVILSSLLGLSI
jgi:hypothetical protein